MRRVLGFISVVALALPLWLGSQAVADPGSCAALPGHWGYVVADPRVIYNGDGTSVKAVTCTYTATGPGIYAGIMSASWCISVTREGTEIQRICSVPGDLKSQHANTGLLDSTAGDIVTITVAGGSTVLDYCALYKTTPYPPYWTYCGVGAHEEARLASVVVTDQPGPLASALQAAADARKDVEGLVRGQFKDCFVSPLTSSTSSCTYTATGKGQADAAASYWCIEVRRGTELVQSFCRNPWDPTTATINSVAGDQVTIKITPACTPNVPFFPYGTSVCTTAGVGWARNK